MIILQGKSLYRKEYRQITPEVSFLQGLLQPIQTTTTNKFKQPYWIVKEKVYLHPDTALLNVQRGRSNTVKNKTGTKKDLDTLIKCVSMTPIILNCSTIICTKLFKLFANVTSDPSSGEKFHLKASTEKLRQSTSIYRECLEQV